jgi:hypothetical protein
MGISLEQLAKLDPNLLQFLHKPPATTSASPLPSPNQVKKNFLARIITIFGGGGGGGSLYGGHQNLQFQNKYLRRFWKKCK